MAAPYIADENSADSQPRIPDWREILAILMERAWIGVAVAVVVFAFFFIQHHHNTVIRIDDPYFGRSWG